MYSFLVLFNFITQDRALIINKLQQMIRKRPEKLMNNLYESRSWFSNGYGIHIFCSFKVNLKLKAGHKQRSKHFAIHAANWYPEMVSLTST